MAGFLAHLHLYQRDRWRDIGSPSRPAAPMLPPCGWTMSSRSWATCRSASHRRDSPGARRRAGHRGRLAQGNWSDGDQKGWTGRVFEDFTVGDIYQHPLGRTVLDADHLVLLPDHETPTTS
jgi:hypothetical protein